MLNKKKIRMLKLNRNKESNPKTLEKTINMMKIKMIKEFKI
jgi:hypothetical protein